MSKRTAEKFFVLFFPHIQMSNVSIESVQVIMKVIAITYVYHLIKQFCGVKVSDNDFPENYDVYINKRYHFSLICSAPRLCFRQSTR